MEHRTTHSPGTSGKDMGHTENSASTTGDLGSRGSGLGIAATCTQVAFVSGFGKK